MGQIEFSKNGCMSFSHIACSSSCDPVTFHKEVASNFPLLESELFLVTGMMECGRGNAVWILMLGQKAPYSFFLGFVVFSLECLLSEPMSML